MDSKKPFFQFVITELWYQKKTITIVSFGIFLISALVAFSLPKVYKSSCTVQIKADINQGFSLPSGLDMLSGKLGSEKGLGVAQSILESRKLSMRIIEDFNLMSRYKTKWEHLAILKFRKNFDFEIEDDGIIKLSFKFGQQDSAKIILDSILSYLNKESIKFATSKAKASFEFHQNMYDSLFTGIKENAKRSMDYMQKKNVFDLEQQIVSAASIYSNLEKKLFETKNELSNAKILNSMTPSQLETFENTIKNITKYQKSIVNKESDPGSFNYKFAVKFDSIPQMKYQLEIQAFELEKDQKVLLALIPTLEKSRMDMINTTPVINIIDPTFRPPYKDGPKRALVIIALSFFFISIYVIVFISVRITKSIYFKFS